MKWVLIILAVGGLFYLGRELMPRSDTVDIEWVVTQIEVGMTRDEVEKLAGKPTNRMRYQVGQGDAWYYTDQYDSKDQLIVQFVEDRVYKVEMDKN